MAYSNVKISFHSIAFTLLVVFLVFMTLGAMIATLVWSGDRPSFFSQYEFTVMLFTLKQAILSSILSCCLAIPISRALFRQHFFLKEYIIRLLGLPFILPVISAIFGLILLFGNTGLLNSFFLMVGLPKLSIYGMSGILIAHVFFNLPLAIRLLLIAWKDIPNEQFKIGSALGFNNSAFFYHLELPMLRKVFPGLLLLIFLICITSFSIALTLGGGPDSTTIEVAIYQALRFQLDFTKAASLACSQFILCSLVAFFLLLLGKGSSSFQALDFNVKTYNSPYFTKKLLDYIWIFLVCSFLLSPLLLLIFQGMRGLISLHYDIYLAALNSFFLSITSAFLGVVMALIISTWVGVSKFKFSTQYIEILSIFILASSPIVMGTGIFLIVKPLISFEYLTPVLVVLVNATMSLPFMLRCLVPAVGAVEKDLGKLADSLSISGFNRLRNMIIPRVLPALGFCFGIGAALSMGDLGVITLFSFGEFQTLPLAIYRLMISYRFDQAFSASILLVIICFFLFQVFDSLGKHYALR